MAPRAFISYSWDTAGHRRWVRNFAARLRSDGVDVTLDDWALAPGDQLPKFMEIAIRENDFVLVVCTPRYKLRSDARIGGVGYEGDIMTAEVMNNRNNAKFIPVLRRGVWQEAAPSWLAGSLYIDYTRKSVRRPYGELLRTLHGWRATAPPLGSSPLLQPLLANDILIGVISREQGQRMIGHDWRRLVEETIAAPLRAARRSAVVDRPTLGSAYPPAGAIIGMNFTGFLTFVVDAAITPESVATVADDLCERYVQPFAKLLESLHKTRYDAAGVYVGLQFAVVYNRLPMAVAIRAAITCAKDMVPITDFTSMAQWRALSWLQRSDASAHCVTYNVRGDVMGKRPTLS